jgi:predicted amidohydrolase YtcJ
MAGERNEPAEVLLVSRRIYPLSGERDQPLDGALLMRDGLVHSMVPRAAVERLRTPDTLVLDVGVKPVFPGFVDPHAHVEVACRAAFGTVDVRAPEVSCVADLQERLAEGLSDAEATGWVIGQGNLFYDRKIKEGRLPTREELDAVSRTVPIAVRAGGHVTVLNSAALEKAGIDRDYEPPEHSVTGKPIVEHCQCHHEPTGVVKEMDNLLPFPVDDKDAIREGLRTGLRAMFTSNGVTTIGEISETLDGISCMDGLVQGGEAIPRLRLYLWSPGTLPIEEGCAWRDHFSLAAPDDHLRVQGIKLFADGGYSAASAAVNSEYVHVDPAHRGEIALAEGDIEKAVGLTADARLQLAIHANGDRAQEWLCEMIEKHGTPAGSSRLRTRIEHAGNFRPEVRTSEAWERAGIVPAPQPVFLYTFGDYFVDYLGDYGSRGRFPFRTLLDAGWPLSASSDVWVGSEREATNPLFGVWCCVARETYAGKVIDPHEALTVGEALRLHTSGGAAAMGESDVKGTLEPGKLADVAVLDRDPFSSSTEDLRHIRADLTLIGGKVAYDRDA